MTVCKFWRQGHCKFGDSCRFEHPAALKAGGAPQNQNQNQDAFMRATPQQNLGNHPTSFPRNNQGFVSNNNRNPNNSRGGRNTRDPTPYGVTREIIEEDLLRERPMWIMSAYGPGRDPDIQLFGGFPLEQSPEEIRVLHYQALASGNPQTSAQVEAELAAKSNEQVQAVLNDLSGALHYLQNGTKEHPNRNDICKQGTSNRSRDGPFSVYNRRRELSSRQGNTNAGGFGQQPAPGFASQQHGFGQAPPNAPQAQFGNQIQSSFGQPQQPPSSFGVPENRGGFATVPATTGFGSSDQAMASPQLGQNGSGFGMANNASPFAQPPQQPTNNVFGQQSQGQPNPFLNAPQQQQQPPPAMNSGFGQQNPPNAIQNTPNPFQQPPQQQLNGFSSNPSNNGDVNSYTTRDASNKLLTWKGRSVNYVNADTPCYQNERGSWVRIWFPDGQPNASGSQGTQAGGHSNATDYSSEVREQYEILKENGSFKDGVVPEVAPMPEMVRWDL